MTNVFKSLKSLLSQNPNSLVAFDQENRFTIRDFQQHLSQAIDRIEHQPHQSYLLYASNSYYFAVNFFALLLLQKDLVLTANFKTDWLESIHDAQDQDHRRYA